MTTKELSFDAISVRSEVLNGRNYFHVHAETNYPEEVLSCFTVQEMIEHIVSNGDPSEIFRYLDEDLIKEHCESMT